MTKRAFAQSSKLPAADWINHDVLIDGLPEISDDAATTSEIGSAEC